MLLKTITIVTVLVALSFGYFWIQIRPRLGAKPSGNLLKQISTSSNYDPSTMKFVNAQEDLVIAAKNSLNNWKFTKEFLFPTNQVTPKTTFPEVKPDIPSFLEIKKGFHFIWLGHSSFLLNLEGRIILVDPVFSNSAAPLDFMVQRFQPPVIELKELSNIDAILISHDHYDHLDSRTIQHFKGKPIHFFVPLGVSAHLISWGIMESRITELDWWESIKWKDIELTCTPAQHLSGRISPYENKTLWASWVIKSEEFNVYYSGDSGYGPHFKEIGEKLGPFDISFIENGQYDDQWRPVHAHPEDTAQAYFDLKSSLLVPVHWGMFNMALHNWYDPVEDLEKHSNDRGINLLTPMIGQVVNINDLGDNILWWKQILPSKSGL